jgi:ribosomal protein L37AE/L43A
MAYGKPADAKEMKCPKCGKLSLKRKTAGVVCNFCGYVLTPGEEVKFRLYELLKSSPAPGLGGPSSYKRP